MAHTIEEMKKAKAELCMEIAGKLETFEEEYGVSIENINYIRGGTVIHERELSSVLYALPHFAFDVKL